MLGVQPSLHNIVIALHEIETHPVLNSCWENCDSSFTQWNAFYIRVYWDTAYLAQLSACINFYILKLPSQRRFLQDCIWHTPNEIPLISMSEASDCKRLGKTLLGADATSDLTFWWQYLLISYLDDRNYCNNAVNPMGQWKITKTDLYLRPVHSI